MPYYPINVDLRGKKCLVVGGGDVAERKVATLLECEADIKVVSPEATDGLRRLAGEGLIEMSIRPFSPHDVTLAFLVIASTDAAGVNEEVSRLAKKAGKLVNVVDDPALCNFIVPATVRRGDLQISVSTGGRSPALSKRIRRDLEANFGSEYADFVKLMGEMRDVAKVRYANQRDREAAFNRILDSDVLELLAVGELESAKKKALECI